MTFIEYLNAQYAVTDRVDSITGQQILPEDDGSGGEGSSGTVSADIATVDSRVFSDDIVKRKDLDKHD